MSDFWLVELRNIEGFRDFRYSPVSFLGGVEMLLEEFLSSMKMHNIGLIFSKNATTC